MAAKDISEVRGTPKARAGATLEAGRRAGLRTNTCASVLYQAMRGGLTGWGTDVETIFETLRGKTPTELKGIREVYLAHYRRDLDRDLHSELKDRPHQLMRLGFALKGDLAAADACVVKAQLDKGVLRGNGAPILQLLRSTSAGQRQALVEAYARLFGAGHSEPLDFFLESVHARLNHGAQAEVFLLLEAAAEKDPTARCVKEAQAFRQRLLDALGSWKDRSGEIFAAIESLPAAQRALLAGDGELTHRLSELSRPHAARALAGLAGDPDGIDAARLQEALAGRKPDAAAVESVLEGKTRAQLKALCEAFFSQTRHELEGALHAHFNGDSDHILTLLLHSPARKSAEQAQLDARRLHRALYRENGADIDALRQVLTGKSRAELSLLEAQYRAFYAHDPQPLREKLYHSLSGRERFEVLHQLFDEGRPTTPAAAVHQLEEAASFERGFSHPLVDLAQRVFKGEADGQRLEGEVARARHALNAGNAQELLQALVSGRADIRAYQSAKDTVAESVAGMSVAMGSSFAMAKLPGSLGMGATASVVLTGAIGAATRMGVKAVVEGEAIGAGSLAREGLLGGIEGGTAALFGGARVEAQGRSPGQRVRQVARQNGVGGAAFAAVDAATHQETWQDGLLPGAGQVGLQAAAGGVLGSLGAVAGSALARGMGELTAASRAYVLAQATRLRALGPVALRDQSVVPATSLLQALTHASPRQALPFITGSDGDLVLDGADGGEAARVVLEKLLGLVRRSGARNLEAALRHRQILWVGCSEEELKGRYPDLEDLIREGRLVAADGWIERVEPVPGSSRSRVTVKLGERSFEKECGRAVLAPGR